MILIKIKQNKNATENEKKGANFYNFAKSNSLTDLNFLEKNIIETKKKIHRFYG